MYYNVVKADSTTHTIVAVHVRVVMNIAPYRRES